MNNMLNNRELSSACVDSLFQILCDNGQYHLIERELAYSIVNLEYKTHRFTISNVSELKALRNRIEHLHNSH